MTHVVHTKVIECFGNLDLLGGVEEGIGELLSLSQCALNDLEA